jgi:hypothetical protein
MELLSPSMPSLFAQLGEANDEAAIVRFMEHNGRLRGSTAVHEAACWSLSQAAFLQDAITLDSNWAAVVDALNVQLHQISISKNHDENSEH